MCKHKASKLLFNNKQSEVKTNLQMLCVLPCVTSCSMNCIELLTQKLIMKIVKYSNKVWWIWKHTVLLYYSNLCGLQQEFSVVDVLQINSVEVESGRYLWIWNFTWQREVTMMHLGHHCDAWQTWKYKRTCCFFIRKYAKIWISWCLRWLYSTGAPKQWVETQMWVARLSTLGHEIIWIC